jgi:PqqD family protein of HPr-rel-A system
MTRIPADPTEQTIWRISQQRAGIWRSWDGEVVVYDDLSGDTMKLDVIMAEAFRFMSRAPATWAQLTDHLASAFELAADPRLQHLATVTLRKFERTGLIERTACEGDPAGRHG